MDTATAYLSCMVAVGIQGLHCLQEQQAALVLVTWVLPGCDTGPQMALRTVCKVHLYTRTLLLLVNRQNGSRLGFSFACIALADRGIEH